MRKIIAAASVLAAASVALAEPPKIPDTPAAVDDVLYARTFTLEQGFRFFWRKERPEVKAGTLLVLKVDKTLVIPRALPTPILYVGNQTAQRVNDGDKSGYVIAIVPGETDLTKAPIWFGTPGLPETVDANVIKAEQAKAEKAGIKPFPAKKVKAAMAAGGEPLKAEDLSELLRTEISELILKYSPQEKHLVEGFRTPVLKRKPKPEKG